jgi:hypothetical protein
MLAVNRCLQTQVVDFWVVGRIVLASVVFRICGKTLAPDIRSEETRIGV